MKRHERDIIQGTAKCEIDKALLDIEVKYELTDGEMISILGSYMSSMAKYMIRYERHGDHDTPGGLEK